MGVTGNPIAFCNVAQELEHSGCGIDLDHGYVGAEREDASAGLEETLRAQSGLDAGNRLVEVVGGVDDALKRDRLAKVGLSATVRLVKAS